MAEFRMPSLGADMQFGTLVRWRVQPGDAVHRGDVVADVETQKGTIEVEIFENGTVQELLVTPGTKLPVGAVMASLSAEVAAAPPVAPVAAHEHGRASPLARRIAADRGIDLDVVRGTGAGGVITREDVERVAGAAPGTPAYTPPATVVAPRAPAFAADAMRQAIAAAMARSHREIPPYYLATDIDLHRALEWLEEANRVRSVEERILPAAMLLKAVALALGDVPELNGFWKDDAFQPSAQVHLGVAVSLRGGGLIAPAIHDAASLTLTQLNAQLRDLVQRARAGGLRSSELADPTITVTNLGDLGASVVFGLVYPPQVALIGFGRISERPWASDGLIGARPLVTATLAADHRVSDGHHGGRFLATLERLLQAPEQL